MTECNVHPRIITRWCDVYFEKIHKGEGVKAARLYFFNHVPDECKARVMAELNRRNGK